VYTKRKQSHCQPLGLKKVQVTGIVAKQNFHIERKPNIIIANSNSQAQDGKNDQKFMYHNLQMLPENLLITDHFKR
jgi:hypothetical protein